MVVQTYMTVQTKDGEIHISQINDQKTDLDFDEFKRAYLECILAIENNFFAVHRCDGSYIIIPVDDIKDIALSFEVLEGG